MDKPVSIYALVDPVTGEPRYVGLTRYLKKRMQNHLYRSHNKHLDRWIKILKAQNTEPRAVVLCVVDERDCDKWERRWIRRMRQRGFNLMNYTDGGERAYSVSLETRAKLSALAKRRWAEDRDGMLAISQSPQGLEKRRGPRGLQSPECAAKTSERLRLLNISRKGVPLSKEHVEKVRQSQIGKTRITPEGRAALSEIAKIRMSKGSPFREKVLEAGSQTRFVKGNKETSKRGGLASAAVMERDPKTGRILRKKAS